MWTIKARFTHKADLVDHKRSHTGEKSCECKICHRRFKIKKLTFKIFKIVYGFKFFNKCSLNEHLKNHTDDKSF